MSDTADSLSTHLRRRIAVEGPLSVATFMTEALAHPRFGYYTTGDPIGAEGDFITAPEISQMFGELVGLWCAHTWTQMGAPNPVLLVELGPGRGTLMQDALRAAAMLPAFRAAVRLHLVETSPVLRRRQAEALTDIAPAWHDRLSDLPPGPMLIVANEFFDALPIRQFQRTDHGWFERLVDIDPATAEDEIRFRFVLDANPARGALLVPPALRAAPPGSIVEIGPAGLSVAREIGERLARHPGAALIMDYGYDQGPAVGETLQAVCRHRYAPVLEAPGQADLTVHVDFTSLAAAACAAGARSVGPIGQGTFLRGLGIVERAQTLKRNASLKQAADVDAALHRLVDDNAMGSLFRVMALTDPHLDTPAGFPP